MRFSPLSLLYLLPFIVSTGCNEAHTGLNVDAHIGVSDTIPMGIATGGNLLVPVRMDSAYDLGLMLHTDAHEVGITSSISKEMMSLRPSGTAASQSWGGQSEASYSDGHCLSIGRFMADSLRVWLGSRSGHGTDGKFGPSIFGDRLVELVMPSTKDSTGTGGALIVHSNDYVPEQGYELVPVRFHDGSMFLTVQLEIEEQLYLHEFLIHTGYTKGLLIDDSTAESWQLSDKLDIVEGQKLTDSAGNTIYTREAKVPAIMVNDERHLDVSVSFFEGRVGAQQLSVVGCDVLLDFDIIFDMHNELVWMRPAINMQEQI